jgi:protein-L-isoaspartate(D-aspartate) O-methyltransferase
MTPQPADYAAQRRNMVESQLRPNKVTDERILTAMEQLPRESFVPASSGDVSYLDEDTPIGNGRFLMEPMLQARLLQAAKIRDTDKVLEIGCATGYGTALLASLSGEVVATDIDSALLAAATANLRRLGLKAQFTASPFERGLPEMQPFDVIMVNGAVAEVPSGWAAQLKDNGRLLVILRADNGVTQTGVARLYQKVAGQFSWIALFDAQTPYLPGMAPRPQFVF